MDGDSKDVAAGPDIDADANARRKRSQEPSDTASGDDVSMADNPIINPEYWVGGPSPAFTVPVTAPTSSPASPSRDDRISDLLQRLEEATKELERSSTALERARRTRR